MGVPLRKTVTVQFIQDVLNGVFCRIAAGNLIVGFILKEVSYVL